VETYTFWWKLILVETISVETIFLVETIFGGKLRSKNSKKGTASNLKDLQIQCSKGTSIFTS
jgi:hypothetical protein